MRVKVSSKVLAAWPVLTTVLHIIDMITMLHQLCVCVGNPDDTFKPLIAIRKGVFKNAQGKPLLIHNRESSRHTQSHLYVGTDTVAKVEASFSAGEETIRHNDCELLLSPGVENRCNRCEAHRKSLLVMVKRLDRPSTSTSPTSHANYRYLNSPLLAERCTKLRTKVNASERRVAQMKAKIEKLSTSQGVVVSTDLEKDLKEIMRDNFTQVATAYKEKTFERIFWEQHAKASACGDARGIRWHPAMIKWCLYLRHLSGKAYETVRNSGVLKLPSQRTLRDYTHYIPSTVGFSAQVDDMLMDTMKVLLYA